MPATFGSEVRRARIEHNLSLREVTERLRKRPGSDETISIQYLNDIELDRRKPPSEYLIRQMAKILELDPDYLVFLAGQMPADLLRASADPERVVSAMRAMRRRIRG